MAKPAIKFGKIQRVPTEARDPIRDALRRAGTQEEGYKALGRIARSGSLIEEHTAKLPAKQRANVSTSRNAENVYFGRTAGKVLEDSMQEDREYKRALKEQEQSERHARQKRTV